VSGALLVRSELRGFQATAQVFKKYREIASPNMMALALKAQAEAIFQISQVYVPKDTMLLHDSGRVVVNPGVGGAVSASVVYGPTEFSGAGGGPAGGGAFYAVYVHENLDAEINWTTPGTGPKYLQRAVAEVSDRLPGIGADAILNNRNVIFERDAF
jgi:hypothetical protein